MARAIVEAAGPYIATSAFKSPRTIAAASSRWPIIIIHKLCPRRLELCLHTTSDSCSSCLLVRCSHRSLERGNVAPCDEAAHRRLHLRRGRCLRVLCILDLHRPQRRRRRHFMHDGCLAQQLTHAGGLRVAQTLLDGRHRRRLRVLAHVELSRSPIMFFPCFFCFFVFSSNSSVCNPFFLFFLLLDSYWKIHFRCTS